MTTALEDYQAALKRLVERQAEITNDAVSIEAGRKPGSIKKSRPEFASLLQEIDAAKNRSRAKQPAVVAATAGLNETIDKLRAQVRDLTAKLNESAGREICLLRELKNVKLQLNNITGGSVVPFMPQIKDDGQ